MSLRTKQLIIAIAVAGGVLAAVPPATAATAPGPPRSVVAQPGNASATITWDAPSDSGSAPISEYRIESSPPGVVRTVGASTRSATVSGLANGTSYTFTITAASRDGTGPASAPSAPVTPSGPPTAPRTVAASAGDQAATISWAPPANDGGSAITSYTVTATPGGRTATVGGATTTARVTGLTNGTAYTFTVTATNARGASPASSPSAPVTPSPKDVRRLAGDSRISTAIRTSQDVWRSVPPGDTTARSRALAVVLSRSDQFADALAGTALAAKKTAPLLLTPPDALGPAVRAEIARVLPAGATVYLLGGTRALSANVEAALRTDGYQVVRLAGADRYETAVAVADRGLGNPRTQLLVTGLDFADALAAGAAAAALDASVLLTAGDVLGPATAAYLRERPGTRIAVGGQAAQAYPWGEAVVGADRYDTAVRVARRFFADASRIGVATGLRYPDALSGGAHAAARGGPLLLVADEVPPAVRQYLAQQRDSVSTVYVYGGTAAVSARAAKQLEAALQ